MGEYATNPKTGRRIKLGTCEDLFYVTRADLEALHAAGWQGDGGATMLEYLNNKACRVCLPTTPGSPGDPDAIDSRKPDYPNGMPIRVDADTLSTLGDVDHTAMYFNKAGTNFIIPCPNSKDAVNLKHSGRNNTIELCAVGCGNGRAIYRCPYCGAKFNLAGHPVQPVVADAFADQWCIGPSKLSQPDAEALLAMIRWQPEPVTAA